MGKRRRWWRRRRRGRGGDEGKEEEVVVEEEEQLVLSSRNIEHDPASVLTVRTTSAAQHSFGSSCRRHLPDVASIAAAATAGTQHRCA